jgi:hypothetical protein
MDNEFKYEQLNVRSESLILKIAKLIAVLLFIGSLLLSIGQ